MAIELAHILLVEDSHSDAELTKVAFGECELEVRLHHVKDGAECMAFLRKRGEYEGAPTPHLVLLDLNMPVMDGRQTLAEIVADDQLKHLPVIILTTSGAADEVVDMYKLRANSFIRKPLNFDDFVRILKGICDYWLTLVRLPPTDAVTCSFPKYRYAVDEHDVIVSVGPAWLAFARENGAAELTEQAVIGRSLWDFMEGTETVGFYQNILHRLRNGTVRVVMPFRCDSPTLRRYMRLEILALPEDWIQFDGILESVEQTRRLNLLNPRFPRSLDMLTVCSCCKRALVDHHDWLEIEDATTRLQISDKAQVPNLRHTICQACLDSVGATPSS